jgi:SNF2 family DNA or RNA helicase
LGDYGLCEAQKIKVPTAMVTKAAKAQKADFKIACTGTPVENSLLTYGAYLILYKKIYSVL